MILLAGHALSGCDTVAACYGIGKGKMLKVLRKRVSLGNIQADWSGVMAQATQFTAECYGQPRATSMSEARISVWTAQIGKPGVTRVPKLASLLKHLLRTSKEHICKLFFGRVHCN